VDFLPKYNECLPILGLDYGIVGGVRLFAAYYLIFWLWREIIIYKMRTPKKIHQHFTIF